MTKLLRNGSEASKKPGIGLQPPCKKRRAVEEHLRSGRSPVGVVKMSPDEGEKFYMEYWQFEGDSAQSTIRDTPSAPLRTRDDDEEAILLANSSAVISFRPPFVLHTDHGPENDDLRVRGAIDSSAVLAMLEKRDFVCPTGTANCSSVGYMNSCCATDENCFVIQDTGLGPVGCCPKGTTCGGTISSCSSPNTPCAQDIGGGCCIPNYVCQGVGCVLNTTVTATIIQTPTTIASSSSPVSTSSTTLTMTSPITTSTTSSTPIPTTTSSSTATGVPPVRPTDHLAPRRPSANLYCQQPYATNHDDNHAAGATLERRLEGGERGKEADAYTVGGGRGG
ncbi:hypothetical protein G7Y89_g6192 [Cudoniella acicularis]|uniref:Uncharacterized protein n=1 Tax=Cudoniella acicularis TaxID=354080 RepID=A0A8H4W2N9_9HELO|nr:hypothetical protein G7Y89_g6192 [Cudoniella acicularis]